MRLFEVQTTAQLVAGLKTADDDDDDDEVSLYKLLCGRCSSLVVSTTKIGDVTTTHFYTKCIATKPSKQQYHASFRINYVYALELDLS